MKKIVNAKLVITILSIIALLTFIILSKIITIDFNFNFSNSVYSICFWIVIPIASVILGGLHLKKHLWLTLIAIGGLDVLLWMAVFGHIPIFSNGTNVEGIAFVNMVIQEVIAALLITSIYAYRTVKGRRIVK